MGYRCIVRDVSRESTFERRKVLHTFLTFSSEILKEIPEKAMQIGAPREGLRVVLQGKSLALRKPKG